MKSIQMDLELCYVKKTAFRESSEERSVESSFRLAVKSYIYTAMSVLFLCSRFSV